MTARFGRLRELMDHLAPEGSPRQKVIQVISVVLLFEGISVIALYSYFGVLIGAVSIAVGLSLLILLYRRPESVHEAEEPIGLRILSRLFALVGGEYVLMSIGAFLIVLVVLYNLVASNRPEYGDADSITILFGLLLLTYPLFEPRARTEASFALIFVGLVFAFLAAPQAFTALSGGGSAGNVSSWYVHYMLAAPFAGILDGIGIPASVQDNIVTITFQDGSVHSLAISTYCAGLYSFSIFLAAFLSFVLVFERLPVRITLVVLLLGLLAAYLGNLIRMVLIGVIGYFEGIDALLWAHRNVGWIIFLSWSSLFWYLIFRYAHKKEVTRDGVSKSDERPGD